MLWEASAWPEAGERGHSWRRAKVSQHHAPHRPMWSDDMTDLVRRIGALAALCGVSGYIFGQLLAPGHGQVPRDLGGTGHAALLTGAAGTCAVLAFGWLFRGSCDRAKPVLFVLAIVAVAVGLSMGAKEVALWRLAFPAQAVALTGQARTATALSFVAGAGLAAVLLLAQRRSGSRRGQRRQCLPGQYGDRQYGGDDTVT